MPDTPNAQPRLIRVWDPGIRIFHWLLVAAIALAMLSSEEESAFAAWHIPIGWIAAVLIAFRLVWGVIGGEHARFASFVRPSRLGAHVSKLLSGNAEPSIGHNPLGALAVLALLGLTGATIFTGIAGGEDTHETLAYALLGLIAVHILAVLLMSHLAKDNLILAMVTGRKHAARYPGARDAAPPTRFAVLAALLAVGGAAYGATRIDPTAFVPQAGGEAGAGEASESGGEETGERDED